MTDEVGQFDYESELDDEVDTIQFGKYKGLTPAEVVARDPGYIVWATNAYPQGWVGSQDIIDRALKIVPSQDVHVKAKQHAKFATVNSYSNRQALIAAFEEAMLETFGEFPTPYWKVRSND